MLVVMEMFGRCWIPSKSLEPSTDTSTELVLNCLGPPSFCPFVHSKDSLKNNCHFITSSDESLHIISLEKVELYHFLLSALHAKVLSSSRPMANKIWSPRQMHDLKMRKKQSNIDETYYFALEELVVYIPYFSVLCRL